MAETDVNNAVLLNTFIIEKKKSKVYLHRGILIWDNEKPPHSHNTLPVEDVLFVHYDNYTVGSSSSLAVTTPISDCNCFTIHYAKRRAKSIWRHHSVTMYHSDPMQVASWVKTLQNHLNSFRHRPKKLLLFVNPFGGKKKALQIFEKHGKPLFNITGVDVNVIISQRQNQIRDCILSLDLNIYDAVACVGGDGTFSEVFNGLVLRSSRENNVNVNDIEAELPKPKLPVGVIPGGSTNTIAYCLHGTVDVQTAVLQIIFGNCLGLDLVSVHNENRLLKLYASVLSYGYLGDVARESEKYRWMGPKRYDFTGFKKFMVNSGYVGELALYPDNIEGEHSELMQTKCTGGCDRCRTKRQQQYYSRKAESNWKIVQGKFFMVSGANISCACARSPNGLSPYSHIGDGSLNLVLVRHTSLFNNLRLLIRLSSKNKTVEDLPFVEIYRAKEFCFRACPMMSKNTVNDPQVMPGFSNWNCDGEVIHDTDLRVKVRCQLLNVLTRGSQEQTQQESCCGFTST